MIIFLKTTLAATLTAWRLIKSECLVGPVARQPETQTAPTTAHKSPYNTLTSWVTRAKTFFRIRHTP